MDNNPKGALLIRVLEACEIAIDDYVDRDSSCLIAEGASRGIRDVIESLEQIHDRGDGTKK